MAASRKRTAAITSRGGCGYDAGPGYKFANWAAGYGDHVHKPDLSTLRLVPWLPGTAMVMCDVFDHHGHDELHPPPAQRAETAGGPGRGHGPDADDGDRLEFYLFEESFDALRDSRYQKMTPVVRYNNDYGIFGSTMEEPVMRLCATPLWRGIAVENTKGEAEEGQHEVNVRYPPRWRWPISIPS